MVSQPYGNEWIIPSQTYFKIEVSADGIYRIPYSLLAQNQIPTTNPDNFIFPILRDTDFMDVAFQGDTKLSKYQYNQISSKTALYNKNLKKIQTACGITTKLSSHISRHTYTDFMLMEDGIDVYDISKSLGHTRLATTEHYLREFSTDRVDDSNLKVNSRFSVM